MQFATHIQNVALYTQLTFMALGWIIEGGRGKNDFHARDKATFFYHPHQKGKTTARNLKTRYGNQSCANFSFSLLIAFSFFIIWMHNVSDVYKKCVIKEKQSC